MPQKREGHVLYSQLIYFPLIAIQLNDCFLHVICSSFTRHKQVHSRHSIWACATFLASNILFQATVIIQEIYVQLSLNSVDVFLNFIKNKKVVAQENKVSFYCKALKILMLFSRGKLGISRRKHDSWNVRVIIVMLEVVVGPYRQRLISWNLS